MRRKKKLKQAMETKRNVEREDTQTKPLVSAPEVTLSICMHDFMQIINLCKYKNPYLSRTLHRVGGAYKVPGIPKL